MSDEQELLSEEQDPATQFPDPLAPTEEEDDDEPTSALRSFMGLFVVPLLVVLACVAVFIGFGWIAYDQN